MNMTSEFKTYEKKDGRVCGGCSRYMGLAHYCTEYAMNVHKDDDADNCAKFDGR